MELLDEADKRLNHFITWSPLADIAPMPPSNLYLTKDLLRPFLKKILNQEKILIIHHKDKFQKKKKKKENANSVPAADLISKTNPEPVVDAPPLVNPESEIREISVPFDESTLVKEQNPSPQVYRKN